MNRALERQLYFDATQQAAPAPDAIDVAADAAAAHRLLQLGISPVHDLPALLLAEPGGKLRVVGLRLTADEIARLQASERIDAGDLLVYSTSWCPDCRRAKRVMEESGYSFSEIDVDRDPQAEATLLTRSGGRRVVPTLRFGDRLWAFNPDPPLLRRLLGR